MTELQSIALALVGVWLLALSLAVLILLREVALLRVRFDLGLGGTRFQVGADGLEIGKPLPEAMRDLLPVAYEAAPFYVLLLSATCTPCRAVVSELRDLMVPAPVTVALSGSGPPADALVELLPPAFGVVRGSTAEDIATLLAVRSTPFVMQLEAGQVTGKAYVRAGADLLRLMETRRRSRASLPGGQRGSEVTSATR